MTEKELYRTAEQEADWLFYYGTIEKRAAEKFDDANFYDRMTSIGYSKVNISLDRRCPVEYITADIPVLEASIEQLKTTT